ncbi:hypothetical protein, partial [Schlesneria sp.]|uniref:hypothetical protein n=1 Tax=Schlesneria sp. TaxID=2762018 RepID=UPI002EE0A125
SPICSFRATDVLVGFDLIFDFLISGHLMTLRFSRRPGSLTFLLADGDVGVPGIADVPVGRVSGPLSVCVALSKTRFVTA